MRREWVIYVQSIIHTMGDRDHCKVDNKYRKAIYYSPDVWMALPVLGMRGNFLKDILRFSHFFNVFLSFSLFCHPFFFFPLFSPFSTFFLLFLPFSFSFLSVFYHFPPFTCISYIFTLSSVFLSFFLAPRLIPIVFSLCECFVFTPIYTRYVLECIPARK